MVHAELRKISNLMMPR
uniref:Uncharacterized protein n=1 Tax=Rhizophora mucronata TaxID=61149 RepID=A0A2P2PQ36_RHIMU